MVLKERSEFDLLKTSESIPLRLLYLLSMADARDRISGSAGMFIEHVELFADYAREMGVWEGPYGFADPYTRFRYFHTENVWQGAKLYDDTKFDVILLSGLPLSGKDSWIEKNKEKMPVISLDNIRQEMNIAPTKGSGRVAQAALEQAKGFLR